MQPLPSDMCAVSAAQTAISAMKRGEGLRAFLHYIYETRARSYRDAVQEFVEGYKEGYVSQPAATSEQPGAKSDQPSSLASETKRHQPEGPSSSQTRTA